MCFIIAISIALNRFFSTSRRYLCKCDESCFSDTSSVFTDGITNSNESNENATDDEIIFEATQLEESETNVVGTFVDLVRANASQKKCIICNRKRSTKRNNKLKRISDSSVFDVYI